MAKLKLGPVVRTKKASNKYCGPAVVSALTGADTAEVARVMRHVSGARSIKGTSWGTVTKVLHLYGIGCCDFVTGYNREKGNRVTLTQWLRQTDRPTGKVFLIAAGHHWQLVSGRRYVCGISKEVVSIRDKIVKRRARVEGHKELYAYRRIGLDTEIQAQLDKADERKRVNARRYNRAMKGIPTVKKMWAELEAAGITVEDDTICDYDGRWVRYWVHPKDEWMEKYATKDADGCWDDGWLDAHTVDGREGMGHIYKHYMEMMRR